jgi:hypothetical protein
MHHTEIALVALTIISMISIVLCGALCWHGGRRGRDHEIREAHRNWPAATRQWLRRETEHLPSIHHD